MTASILLLSRVAEFVTNDAGSIHQLIHELVLSCLHACSTVFYHKGSCHCWEYSSVCACVHVCVCVCIHVWVYLCARTCVRMWALPSSFKATRPRRGARGDVAIDLASYMSCHWIQHFAGAEKDEEILLGCKFSSFCNGQGLVEKFFFCIEVCNAECGLMNLCATSVLSFLLIEGMAFKHCFLAA